MEALYCTYREHPICQRNKINVIGRRNWTRNKTIGTKQIY